MKQFLFGVSLAALVIFSFSFEKPQQALPVGAEPFIGEIMLFAGNFEPRGWAFCDGRLLSIAQNTALFSILGTTYGGDGQTTFALPDLRGRVAVGPGQGPGLSRYDLGEAGGQESVSLSAAQMPAHNHAYSDAKQQSSGGAVSVLTGSSQTKIHQTTGSSTSAVTQNAGGSQPHENRQPYLGMNYAIAVQGIFPPRD
ncbi:MAG: phage tail protein [Saprospirales bacterium]|nr:phage tail protein [Saprospirales bacterium]